MALQSFEVVNGFLNPIFSAMPDGKDGTVRASLYSSHFNSRNEQRQILEIERFGSFFGAINDKVIFFGGFLGEGKFLKFEFPNHIKDEQKLITDGRFC